MHFLISFQDTRDSEVTQNDFFMISFTETRAQKMSLAYLEERMEPGIAYYVGGHSKGANEVLYAAAMLPEKKRSQLRHLYINDGPGFCKEVLDPGLIGSIEPISTAIRPEYCVIGKLFEPRIDDCLIVKSTQKGGMQHSIFSWGIEAGRLLLVDEYDPQSLVIASVMDKWLENVSTDERRIFTDNIFDALEKDGSKTLFDVLEKGPASVENMVVSMLDADPAAKDTLRKLPEAAIQEEKKAAEKVTRLVKKEIAHQPYLLDAAMAVVGILLMVLPVKAFDYFMAVVLLGLFLAETGSRDK